MSDTQAEDRLAQLQADLSAIISKRADCLRIQEAAAIAEAIAELSRLSRVEQALRALVLKWDESAEWEVDNGDMTTAMTYSQCATEAQAVLSGRLSASPEAQPEDGR